MQTTEEVRKPLRRYQVVWRWGLLVAYAGCIFTLSAIPGHALPSVRISDKLLHIGEFGVLGLLMCRAFGGHMIASPRGRIALLSAMATILYGASDEFHQLFVAHRSAELIDFVADSLGGVLAAWGWYKVGTYWTWLQ